MRISETRFSRLANEKTLRNDCVYQRVITGGMLASKKDFYRFSDLFSCIETRVHPDSLNDEFMYCQIGDVDKTGLIKPVTLNFSERNLLDEDYYKKIEKGDIMAVEENDILISFLLPQDEGIMGKFAKISVEESEVLFSRAFLRIKPISNPEILYYYLKSCYYPYLVATARIRKGYTGYATLSNDDLADLRFDKKEIDALFANSDELTREIQIIEKEIGVKQKKVKALQSIIDQVFAEEFSYDYDRFEELKRDKNYYSKCGTFSNNPDLRFSAKYHRPAGDYVIKELTKASDKKIKHYISEPIVLGASISPCDFDETGTAYYVSMATIKNLEVELDDNQRVSNSYYEGKRNDKAVQVDDIIIARSGVAIGKTAIVKTEFEGIFADFTMRVRFDKEQYNPLFAYYYIRSKYFQYLIEINKKGLQNQNIFPVVLKELPVPDISLKEQGRIVKRIQDMEAEQDKVKDEIIELNAKIEAVIKHCIIND